jgi:hypothetical protein
MMELPAGNLPYYGALEHKNYAIISNLSRCMVSKNFRMRIAVNGLPE